MIKALMVVSLVNGMTYTSDLTSLKECFEKKEKVQLQSEVTSVACVPRSNSNESEMLDKFMNMFFIMTSRSADCGKRPGFYYSPEDRLD